MLKLQHLALTCLVVEMYRKENEFEIDSHLSISWKNLGFFEIGNVYFVSQKKTDSLKSMMGVKIWSWEGDELVSTMIESMKFVSVPLPLPDVLSSLSTGIIEAAYAPPLGILSLQWNTKIKYLIDFPTAFSIGALLISKKSWDKISAKDQIIFKILAGDGSYDTGICLREEFQQWARFEVLQHNQQWLKVDEEG